MTTLGGLHGWLEQHTHLVPLQSAMGYLHKKQDKLTPYITDGRLRIDNNLTENTVKLFVIGRMNFFFCDSVAGANASANLYSLIETAKANGIESYPYLKLLFTELPKAGTVEDVATLLLIVSKADNRVAA